MEKERCRQERAERGARERGRPQVSFLALKSGCFPDMVAQKNNRTRNAELSASLAARISGENDALAAERRRYEELAATELAAMAKRLAAAEQERDELRVSANGWRESLARKSADSEALLSEMGLMVGAVEELQRQNERLLSELAQRDHAQQALIQVTFVVVFLPNMREKNLTLLCFSAKGCCAPDGDSAARGKESADDENGGTEKTGGSPKDPAHALGQLVSAQPCRKESDNIVFAE